MVLELANFGLVLLVPLQQDPADHLRDFLFLCVVGEVAIVFGHATEHVRFRVMFAMRVDVVLAAMAAVVHFVQGQRTLVHVIVILSRRVANSGLIAG